MKWNHFSVKAEAGCNERLPCSVCGRLVTDILYTPANFSENQAKWIEKIWNKCPFTEFTVCEDCMMGHCGAVPGRNANNWLEKEIENYKKRLPNKKDI